MRIDNWPMERIMQLPDWCFGRRWMVGVRANITSAAAHFDICEFAFPERAVVWEINIHQAYYTTSSSEVCLALGDHLPANAAEFAELPLLFPGAISPSGQRGAFICTYLYVNRVSHLRKIVEAHGNRLVGSFVRIVGDTEFLAGNVVISSVPREVPDWLISAKAIDP